MNASSPCPDHLFIITELFRSWALSLSLPHLSKFSAVKPLWEELRQAGQNHNMTTQTLKVRRSQPAGTSMRHQDDSQ